MELSLVQTSVEVVIGHVDIEGKKIIYGDSLAWPFLDGLLCRMEK